MISISDLNYQKSIRMPNIKMFFKPKKIEVNKEDLTLNQDLAIITKMNQEFAAGQAMYDERLACAIIEDSRHNLKLYVWPNGKCVASDARHPNMVAMSAIYWKGQLEEHNLFL